ncbi:hypothetical protein G9C85_01565 [Halorubellus sp. JP-L1]|nr:hypothetical protein [Halorubellus sp. JP-L1]NHN40324.1 hypothetical protein [Halorubellus sp. JP-L1]
MDARQKALVVFTVVAMVLAFGYFNVLLGGLAALASIPFLVGVLRR